MSTAPSPLAAHRVRPLPVVAALRLGRPSDIWFKPALSVVVATAIPDGALLAAGRLDLATATTAGSLCALYGHHLPYRARSRAVGGVVLGMLAGSAAAMAAAALTTSVVLLVAIGALLAAVQKALCDATRTGPPGHVILAFVSSATLFAPITADRIPGRLALTAAAGALAWLVCLAPALVRRDGPERYAVARALDAAAALTLATDAPARDRHRAGLAAAVHSAWQCLLAAGPRTPDRASPDRASLARLVVHAENALADGHDTRATRLPAAALTAHARTLRTGRPVPATGGGEDELLGLAAEFAGHARPARSPLRALGPGSPLLPIATRTFLGCALAGWAAAALGVGRPSWAIVTAASLYQVNLTLTWNRTLQRVVGNLLGVLLFAAVAPIARQGAVPLVLCCLAAGFGAEALIARNYWLGSVCVTPMALLVTEFGRTQQTGELITDRVADTLTGALAGLVAVLLVTNRRAGARLEHALTAAAGARTAADRLLTGPAPALQPATLAAARRTLTGALVDLRTAADAATGEWWQRALPEQQVVAEERAGHRTLAATVRLQGPPAREGTTR
ncbi:FUSC family protein [Kitasatospora sp. NBC_01539]|uniref:FUSC family protein n=1 Tax=Kitasatospora sp. NBC_01539 TaxID=2903577 RepID=UPI0038601C11